MSASCESVTNTMQCCASCGIAGVDEIKLKKCDDCDLVKYCSDECQEDHRPKHEEDCKKRAAELRDELLFKQPESSHLGDCPICCLPLSIDPTKSTLTSCCSKSICNGCNCANQKREYEGRLQQKCAFCREPLPKTEEEWNERLMKRIEANDPVAMREMGGIRYHEGDYKSSFEYYLKAATLGDVKAHYQLSCMYRDGQGVEKNENKQLNHLTEAAIGGNPNARHNLGCKEMKNGQYDRAAKHFIIASKLGYDKSLKCLREIYKAGLMSKDDFTAALRSYQTAIAETKSPQRVEAAEFHKKYNET